MAVVASVIIVILVLLVVVFFGIVIYLGYRIGRPPESPPKTVRVSAPTSAPVLMCLGDSMTHGHIGASWVNQLRARFRSSGRLVANGGANGEMVWNVAQRLDRELECEPDLVVLMIGSNDVMAADRPDRAREYHKSNKLPRIPNLEWSLAQLQELVPRLAGAVPRVALCTIPPLGDDERHSVVTLVTNYNNEVRKLAAEHNCALLDVHEAIMPLLSPAKKPYDGKMGLGKFFLLMHVAALHYLLGKSWDDITRRKGFGATFDGIHLSNRAANQIADLVAAFVEGTSAV